MFVDLGSGTMEERESQTREEVAKRSPVIYQPILKATCRLEGTGCEIHGAPDFLICQKGQYVIRDSKISRRITEEDHPEILRQIELYAWLYEKTFGQPPLSLQVHCGTGEIVSIEYDDGRAALEVLGEILAFKQCDGEPYSPVGWSKCSNCGFYEHCWPKAEKTRDIAMVAGVDQSLAIALQGKGIRTVEEFLATFDEETLSEFSRPWGRGTQRVGKRATTIIRMAQAMATGRELFVQAPSIPCHANYVMFDIEGIPPQFEDLEKIYLWGLQVCGKEPSEYLAATSSIGLDGDRQGWEKFLNIVKKVVGKYGDIPFVHWHHYERVHVDKYIERFGDPEGVANRVRKNLLDLYPVTQSSVALPLPSYSLKVVEKYVGFTRTQHEYGGDWAMAKYIEATESEDENLRAKVLEEILLYNREDLAAIWAVLKWLKSKVSPH
jgi:predicted RecB family nuclease